MHWYYRLPQGVVIGNTVGRLAAGIDTRGERGYVICPPSLHRDTGQPYGWVVSPDEHPVAAIPKRLLARLLPVANKEPSPTERPQIVAANRSSNVALRILAAECERIAVAAQGTRNHTAFGASAAIGNLVAAGELVFRVAADALREAALACGLPPAEAEAVVLNGLRQGMMTPRTIRKRGLR